MKTTLPMAALAALLISTPVLAADKIAAAHPFKGPYIQAGLGGSLSSAKLGDFSVAEESKRVGARIGHDIAMGPMIVGILAGIDHDFDDTVGETSWHVGGRAGVPFGNVLLYGLAAYGKALNSGDDIPDFSGFTVGGGFEVALSDVRLALEVTHFRPKSKTVELEEETAKLVDDVVADSLKVNQTVIMLRVAYALPFGK